MHAGAYRLDHAGALIAQDHGHRVVETVPRSVRRVQAAMANPARGHLDLNLPLLGIFYLYILDPHRFPLPVEEWRFDHLSHLAYLLIQKPVSREFDGKCRRLPVSTG